MANENNDKLKWSSLIMGTLLLIIAVVIFSYPVRNFYVLTWLIGLLILINGVIGITFRKRAKAAAGANSNMILVTGIIDIIFGLIVLFNVGVSSTLFIYLFAFWFILSSILGLMTMTNGGALRALTIVTNILGIILGVLLLFNPFMGMIFVSLMIAVTFAIIGIIYVIDGCLLYTSPSPRD